MRFTRDELSKRLSWGEIDVTWLREFAQMALREDVQGEGLKTLPLYPRDITTELVGASRSMRAALVAREPAVVAGMGIVEIFLEAYGSQAIFIPLVQDGAIVSQGAVLGTIQGAVHAILQAERPMLNTLQYLCGIATHTAAYQRALGKSTIRLLDTRKTLPGWRLLEKYAVGCGGAYNHRLGLFDRILIKDNHLALELLPQLKDLLIKARIDYPFVPIEVEVDHLGQIPVVLEAQPDVILLDNFSDQDLQLALTAIDRKIYTEVSGGVTLQGLPSLAQLPLDFISTSQLSRGAKAIDIGLDF